MRIRRTAGEKSFEMFNITFMILIMTVTLYPFLYVVFASISIPSRMIQHTGILYHSLGFSLNSYIYVFENPNIMIGYANTIFYVVVGTGINLLLTAFGAYVLSRKRVYWKNAIMFLAVFTMFFNGGLIPTFLQVKALGLLNSRWSVILPTAINTFNLIVMRTAFQGIPDSMEESAKLDGANDFVVLFKIIWPLSLPVIAVMVLFYGVGHWNDWFQAMLYIRSRGLYPLQLTLREILVGSSTDDMTTAVGGGDKEPVAQTVKYATIIVATLPVLFIYPFLQKYFVKGIMLGAIKG